MNMAWKAEARGDAANGAESQTHPTMAGFAGIPGMNLVEGFASRHRQKCLWFIVIAGLLARIVVAVHFTDINPATAQIWEYGTIAIDSLKHGAIVTEMHLHDGQTFVYPTAFMPPLLIFIWMALFAVLGVSKAALAAMTALNVIFGAGIVYYVARVAKILVPSNAASLIAAAIAALHPVFVFSVVTYHAVNLYILMLLAIFDLCSTRQPPSLGKSILIGILLGLAALVRTEYLVLGGAILLGSLWWHRKLMLTLSSLVVAAAVILPWTARNYLVLHQFVPVANSAGYNMFKGFDPEANGSGHWVDRNLVASKLLGPQLAAVPHTASYESDVDKVYKDAAKQFIREHPLKAFVELPVRKILLFWLFDIYDPQTHQILYQLALWPLTILAILGLLAARRVGLLSTPDHRTVMILFVTETLLMASYAVHARYRMNVEPFLFCYAALGLMPMLAWLSSFRGSEESSGRQS